MVTSLGREIEILVAHQPPQEVVLCDHAGLVTNSFSAPADPASQNTVQGPNVDVTTIGNQTLQGRVRPNPTGLPRS